MNRTFRFRVCRACLSSSKDAAEKSTSPNVDLINLFDGKNVEKFQIVSGVDISPEKDNHDALICERCMQHVNEAIELRNTIRSLDNSYFNELREEEEEEIKKMTMKVDKVVGDVNQADINEEFKSKIDATMQELSCKMSGNREFPLKFEGHEEQHQIKDVKSTPKLQKDDTRYLIVKKFAKMPTTWEQRSSENDDEVYNRRNSARLGFQMNKIKTLEVKEGGFKQEGLAIKLETPQTLGDLPHLDCSIADATSEENEPLEEIDSNDQPGELKMKLPSSSKKPFSVNIRRIRGSKSFQCDLCSKLFFDKRDLLQHIIGHQRGEEKLQETFKKAARIKLFRCPVCGKKFVDESGCHHHIKVVHKGKKNVKCERCAKKFCDDQHLTQHLAQIHKLINGDTANCTRPFKCDVEYCGKFFRTRYQLNKHKREVHEGNQMKLKVKMDLKREES